MSAALWPREAPRPTESQAEIKVYDALSRQLPRGWTAWHSLRVRTSQGVEGEGDFVIAIPERGFLVLEVKGGQMELRDGRWYQNGRPLDRAPRDQAHAYAKTLLGRLKELGMLSVPYGILTLFPDTAFSQPPTQDDLGGLLLGEQDLPWLAESIAAKLDRAFPQGYQIPPGNWVGLLHRLWGETWVPKLQLGHKARLDADERLRLDAQQLLVLDGLLGNRRLLVEGVAGSGKTLLAREAALRMAEQGRRVLYLCYTDALARWLRPTLEQAGVEVFTVPRYAVHRLQAAGLLETIPDASDFWSQVSLQAAADALPGAELRPEIVILDEAQDLAGNDWVLVEELMRGQTGWIFHDPAQAFWQDRPLPAWTGAGGFYRLTRGYRCPPAVLAYARAVAGLDCDQAVLEQGLAQGIVRVVEVAGEGALPGKIENEITRLRAEGFAPQDIAVLSLRGQSAVGSICQRDRIGHVPVVRADDPAMESHVVADTFLRFKGLERPVVIVTDLRLVQDRMAVRMHIALTRATTVVRVVGVQGGGSSVTFPPKTEPLQT